LLQTSSIVAANPAQTFRRQLFAFCSVSCQVKPLDFILPANH
jgi:hypothetical protein